MKNIYNIIYLFGIALIFGACSNDDEKLILNPEGASVINTPSNGQEFILNQLANPTNTAITITWEDSQYLTETEIDYAVEFAMGGTNFSEIVTAGTTNNTFFTMNVSEFNSAVSGAGLSPFTEGSLDIRIKSTIGTRGDMPQYSDPITVLVTPFTTELPKIAVPGNHQGWDPPTAEVLASSAFGETDYEGYVWLDGGHKFVAPDENLNFNWGNTDWGDDGSFSGVLLEEGEVDCMANAGYYFIQVDTSTLTYSETMYNWGIIGSATPTNWDSDTDMTYDPVTKTWRIDITLSAEEIKFRANDDWGWNYGDNDANGSLDRDGANIAVPAAGNYTVVLDLSVPREYTYTLIQN